MAKKSWFSKLFGARKRRTRIIRIATPRRAASPRRAGILKTVKTKVFVYYDKDDLSVPDYRYHWYAVSASSKKKAAEALRDRVNEEVWGRMKGPLPQKEVGPFMANDAPHEKVTRVKA